MLTVFERIIQGELPCKKVFENERILAIEDLYPVAPIHILIMPKRVKIPNLQSVQSDQFHLIGEIVSVAQKIAEEKGIANGYRLLTNNGPDAGQTVFYLHFHLIGGRVLGKMG